MLQRSHHLLVGLRQVAVVVAAAAGEALAPGMGAQHIERLQLLVDLSARLLVLEPISGAQAQRVFQQMDPKDPTMLY